MQGALAQRRKQGALTRLWFVSPTVAGGQVTLQREPSHLVLLLNSTRPCLRFTGQKLRLGQGMRSHTAR